MRLTCFDNTQNINILKRVENIEYFESYSMLRVKLSDDLIMRSSCEFCLIASLSDGKGNE